MARKGRNKKTRNQTNSNAPAQILTRFAHPTSVLIENEFEKTFYAEGFEWNGLQRERVYTTNIAELNLYLDEIDDVDLYEQTLLEMLKKLQKDQKINWYELSFRKTDWNDDMIIIKAK